ncbi:MAG: hypothetical protein WC761_04790 [Candidatus Paceibacterota bacterium]|jgi:hypothetical protein
MKKEWQLKTLILTSLLALSQSAFALTAADLPIPTQIPDLDEQVEGTMTPQYPSPGEKVVITLEAYGTDLNRATIVWSINGSETLRGKGQKSLSLVAGSLGESQVIKAAISPVNGIPVTKTFYVNPQSIDVVWQADTYTPPFYRGKAMFSPQTKVTLVAMPNLIDQNGSQVDPGSVIYKWKKDFVVLGKNSGYGAQTLSYKGDILMQPVNIGIEASIEGGNTAATYLDLAPTSPIVGLYEQSPIYGTLYNKEVSGTFDFGNSSEKNILVVPYFFSEKGKKTFSLAYEWSINGSIINVPSDQNTMTLRNSENLEGQSQIGVTVSNTENFLEGASGSTLINFKKSSKATSL